MTVGEHGFADEELEEAVVVTERVDGATRDQVKLTKKPMPSAAAVDIQETLMAAPESARGSQEEAAAGSAEEKRRKPRRQLNELTTTTETNRRARQWYSWCTRVCLRHSGYVDACTRYSRSSTCGGFSGSLPRRRRRVSPCRCRPRRRLG